VSKRSRKEGGPPRVKSLGQRRLDYYKRLGTRPVSGTTTDIEIPETYTEGGTDYMPKKDKSLDISKTKEKSSLRKFFKEHLGVTGVISLVIFIVGIVTAYNNVLNKIENISAGLSEYKKDTSENIDKLKKEFKDDIRYLTDRMDKYISKKP